jgi:four helix bundle protein
MSNEDGRRFDLTERTAVFGEELIAFLKQLPVNDITGPLIRQVVRSGTSIGANYSEADEAGTKKQFRNFISTCKREAKETKYWLRMIAAAVPDKKSDARTLWKEADELNRIFAAIHRNSKDEDN